MTYDGTDTEDVFSRYLYDVSMYDSFDSNSPVKYNAKIVVDYTYPDGTTGTLESQEFDQASGRFAQVTSVNIGASNAMLTAEVSVNLAFVDMAHLTYEVSAAYSEADGYTNWTDFPTPQLVSSEALGDGTQRMVFQVQLTNPASGLYHFTFYPYYDRGRGPVWSCLASGQVTY